MDKRKKVSYETLSPAARRALNDLYKFEGYLGQAATGEALVELEERGLVRLVHVKADRGPMAILNAKGRRTFDQGVK